jgi:hypothetical protein
MQQKKFAENQRYVFEILFEEFIIFLGWARPEYDLLHLDWAQPSRMGCPDDPARSNHGLVTVHEHQSIN